LFKALRHGSWIGKKDELGESVQSTAATLKQIYNIDNEKTS